MPVVLINPMREESGLRAPAAPRLETLEGKTIGLLDISKPGGSIFLDRLEWLLKERYGVARVLRVTKPTFAKPAPADVLNELRQSAQGVIEALAD
jgi:hypothetical protein